MLPKKNRMKKTENFKFTVKSGTRIKSRNIVLYGIKTDKQQETKIGFIVAKSVGNAAKRNKVKRRLRAISKKILEKFPENNFFVLRALTDSANKTYQDLEKDIKKIILNINNKPPMRKSL